MVGGTKEKSEELVFLQEKHNDVGNSNKKRKKRRTCKFTKKDRPQMGGGSHIALAKAKKG